MGGWPQKFNLKIDDDMAIEVKTQRPIPKSARIKSTKVQKSGNDTIEEVAKNSTKKDIIEVTKAQLNTSKSSNMSEIAEQDDQFR